MCNEWADALEMAGMNNVSVLRNADSSVSIDRVDSPQLVSLAGLSVVDICGEDATAFLQGQFSNDLKQVSTTRAQITGYCTPKGRMLALPTIVGMEGGYRLLVPEDVKEGFLKRLSMFIMRARVTIVDRTDWMCTGVIAAEGGGLTPLEAELGVLPAGEQGSVMNTATGQDQQIIRWHDMRGSTPRVRYLVLASKAQQLSLWQAGRELPIASDALWRLGDIRAGLPSITSGVLEAFVPQMLNLQLVDGLSFTKGCYPGQEIVARMQYLGKLKRHMRRFSLPSEAGQGIPVPGATLLAGDDANAGVVVDAVSNPAGEIELLAVVKVSTTDVTLSLGGESLSAAELPYALPSLEDAQLSAG